MINIELREYQKNILDTCLKDNTLVILPTGTGKTIIAFFLIIERLKLYPDKKVYFLAPTKPLVSQHYQNFIKIFEEYKDKSILITGDINNERRSYLYKQGQIIFITPQTLQNDLISGKVIFYDSSTIIFDEAHRAVKKYSYTFIAQRFYSQNKDGRILALTASPGWNIDRIKEVMENLHIKNIEIRTGKEEDIEKYMKDIDIEKYEVDLDDKIKNIISLLNKAYYDRLYKVKELDPSIEIYKGKTDILQWITEIKKNMQYSKDYRLRIIIILLSELLKISHAIELLETQSLGTFIDYYNQIENSIRKSRADYNIINDIRIKKAVNLTKEYINHGLEHPKLLKLIEILKENKDKKIIVFAQIRKTLDIIKDVCLKNGIKAEKFVGKKEMNRLKQAELLKMFSENQFSVLLSTSVGEEGIDIPKVDIVIFYEPVPSEIRYIQRRGRTGRGEIGRTIILITRGTLDQRFYWVAIQKERKMFTLIKRLKKYINININNNIETKMEKTETKNNTGIIKYISNSSQETTKEDNTPIIIADYKEKESGVIQTLANTDILVKLDNLETGDYIIGDYIIERKNILDFINSILDGRLYNQLERLKDLNSILILEGSDDNLDLNTQITKNYLRTLILKIMFEYDIPIIRTYDFLETANYLYLLAKNYKKFPKIPEKLKKYSDLDEIKLEILKIIPGIGENLAYKLLERFKSLKNIFLAQKADLRDMIGEKKADRIKKIFEEEFKKLE
ncbi:DEAD/DEAH box helicase [Nanobdella aerobiophila]|uniref:DEAD/DEAH box helicase n=1 Tax=Nanobdella aerobiophila TaxID=2586965 RepID=A0A915SSG3_9ARCH|nr:DEAD/DEAH box helicase family protein [Nanobdella aerobiophila]BBL45381.1 DEAD/DEAH box helicase [Nanobdella aerobiophila]